MSPEPNLELPPERRLEDKTARVDRILQEASTTPAPGRSRQGWYALAAAIAVIVGVLGLGLVLRPGGPDVAGPPPPPSSPTDSPVTSPTPTRSDEPELLRVGQSTELEFFTFTLLDTRQTSAGFAAEIRVCLTGTPPNYASDSIPIGWYAWRAVTKRNSYQANVEDLSDPAFQPVYPSGRRFAVGECVEGWLPFEAIGAAERVTELRYSNDYGGEARWRID